MEHPKRQPPEFDLNAFLGQLAHDLANPLNAISMNAELVRLLSQKGQTGRVPEVMERVIADCARCSRFLRDLRTFADATKRRTPERVPAQIVVDSAELIARAAVTDKFPEIQLSGAETSLQIERAPVEAALAALLRNAADAGAKNVAIGIAPEAGGVRITLSDDGAGLAPDAAARLGQPFFTTRRAQGHSGIGWMLCRHVAQAYGGDFTVAPGTGGGAVATLRLPVPAGSG